MNHRLKQGGHVGAVQQMQLPGADFPDGEALLPQGGKILQRPLLSGLCQIMQEAFVFCTRRTGQQQVVIFHVGIDHLTHHVDP